METDEPDEESSQDQDLPSENERSPSEDSVSAEHELENGLLPPERKRLFTLHFNNMGKSDFIKGEVRFDEDHTRLNGALLYPATAQREPSPSADLFLSSHADRGYLSLDWEPDIKRKFFSEAAAEVKLSSTHVFCVLTSEMLI